MNVGTLPMSKLRCLSGKLHDENGGNISFLSLFNISQSKITAVGGLVLAL